MEACRPAKTVRSKLLVDFQISFTVKLDQILHGGPIEITPSSVWFSVQQQLNCARYAHSVHRSWTGMWGQDFNWHHFDLPCPAIHLSSPKWCAQFENPKIDIVTPDKLWQIEWCREVLPLDAMDRLSICTMLEPQLSTTWCTESSQMHLIAWSIISPYVWLPKICPAH